MPNLSLAEAKERLLDAAAKLTSARGDLESVKNQLGFPEGRRDLLTNMVVEIDLDIRWLMAMCLDIKLDPDVRGTGVE